MRICIYGAGAMGTSFGVRILDGIPCDFVSRNRAHVSALQTEGARLVYPDRSETRKTVTAYLSEEMTGQYDIIFLATKQRDNRAICRFLLPYLKRDGAIVCLQNGYPEMLLAQYFGAERVYGCVLSWGAEMIAPGTVRITGGDDHLYFGAYAGGKRETEIAALLGGAQRVETGNLKEYRYAKLAVNASFSTLSAISGLSFGELAGKHRALVLSLMREVFSVARADGCRKLPLGRHDLFRVFGGFWAGALLPAAMKKYRDTRSGMLKDLDAGKRCDVDFVAGAAICAGERLGVETPSLKQAVSLLHDIENGLAEIAPDSLLLLKQMN